MNINYLVAFLAICILGLAYYLYKVNMRQNSITSDIQQLYKTFSEQLASDIQAKNEQFRKQVNSEVQQRLIDAGVSKQQLDDLQSQTIAVQQTVTQLQSDVKSAALQHISDIQQMVDNKMQLIQDNADQLLQQNMSKLQDQGQQLSDSSAGYLQVLQSQNAQFANDMKALQTSVSQQIQQDTSSYQNSVNQQYTKYTDDLNVLSQDLRQQMMYDAAGYQNTLKGQYTQYNTQALQQQKELGDQYAVYRTQLKADSDSFKSQLQSAFDAIKTQLAGTVSTYQTALKGNFDQFNTNSQIVTTSYISSIKTQGDQSSKMIKDAITAFQSNDVPTLVSSFSKSLQDIIYSTQADMQKMLYGYGYRRSYNCSFNIVDNGQQPINLVNIQSIIRKVGSSITVYTCTLPVSLPYDYTPIAQIITNRAEATTSDNDIASLVTKTINSNTFSVAVERLSSGPDVTIAVSLVEK